MSHLIIKIVRFCVNHRISEDAEMSVGNVAVWCHEAYERQLGIAHCNLTVVVAIVEPHVVPNFRST